YKTVNLDFQQADKAIFINLNRFLRWFCSNISRELGLDARLDDYWDEEMGIKISCSIYFEAYLLSSLETPVVIVLNEVDLVFEHPEIASDFLPLLRSWYEQAKRVDIWQKLRIVLTYSTEIIVPLNLSQSPFNIGLPLKLPAFTKEQVQNLAQLYGLDWMDACNTDKLMAMVGGHPYLVRLALYYLRRNKNDPESLKLLLQQAPTQAGIYNSHLRRYVLMLLDDLQLKSVFCELIAANSPRKLEAIVAYRLQSMGLIKLDGDNASVACELYRLYFREQLSKLELRFDSNLDPLTQLINRPYFDICLQRLWQQSKRAELSLILCDIDYFKYYNKNYGTTAGDKCLQQIANTMRDRVDVSLDSGDRNSKIIARYAGDKFAVVIPVNEAIAFSIAEDIKEKIQALAIESEYPGMGGLPAEVITVTVGVASTIPPNIEPVTLLKIAESALYQAKRKGRNCVALSQAV
ncbi:MAG: AAA-like domain-containing protein, partial [Rivularia sp. (in: cyanobacteria)]